MHMFGTGGGMSAYGHVRENTCKSTKEVVHVQLHVWNVGLCPLSTEEGVNVMEGMQAGC